MAWRKVAEVYWEDNEGKTRVKLREGPRMTGTAWLDVAHDFQREVSAKGWELMRKAAGKS